ncbi:hypothetical protein Ddc_15743 [Ditylenchus destructor]|nr:hypothetical protein Ddc_15743 [Ditylenchus destructor]
MNNLFILIFSREPNQPTHNPFPLEPEANFGAWEANLGEEQGNPEKNKAKNENPDNGIEKMPEALNGPL